MARAVHVRVIGSLEVVGAHGRLAAGSFPSRKSAQVLASLALAGGRPVAKERLVDQIWGERLPEDPLGALEQAVSVLRRALRAVTEEPVVVTRGGGYLLDPAGVAIDLVELSAAIAPFTARSTDGQRADALWQALGTVDGELLEDQPAAPWVEHARERFRADVEAAWLTAARLSVEAGDDARAAFAAGRVRALAPVVHDEAYEIEARASARTGDHHRALRLVDELEGRIAGERRRPRVDIDALRAACGEPHRGTRVVTALPHDAEPVVFVGRSNELAAVRAPWAGPGGERCSVTLVDGPAGSGRTRLVAALAEGAPGVVVVACHPGDREQPLLVAARVMRAVSASSGRTRSPRPADSAAVVHQRLVTAVERAGRVVICIDDAHRADDASVAVLAALAEPAAGLDLHLVLTTRAAFADDVAGRLGETCRRISIGPLDAAVIADRPGAWEETGGHPATLVACVEAARRDGRLLGAEVRAVTARVDELPAAYRDVVVAAATAGDRGATMRTLVARTGMVQRDIEHAIDVSVQAGVMSREGRVVRVIPAILRRALAGRING